MTVEFILDGKQVSVEKESISLLRALRDELGIHSVKDGCSPQGQCGCCTVLVDGAARVSCVTPVRRVTGADVRTVDGLDPEVIEPLASSFLEHGASQCGFCTPGILVRIAALGPKPDAAKVRSALLAHLCRCTGWLSILEAALSGDATDGSTSAGDHEKKDSACVGGGGIPPRDLEAASVRATLEGGSSQDVGLDVVLGRAGFADDLAPPDALVAVPDGAGGWAFGADLDEARQASGKIQGRRSGRSLTWPLEVPPGEWDLTLRTTWVEPGYLEPDASWCLPGGQPASSSANGGAFGGKKVGIAEQAARELADRLGKPVRVVLSREDVVRMGPKRPPVAVGLRADGSGIMSVVATPGFSDAVRSVSNLIKVEQVEEKIGGSLGTSSSIRAAGWAEASIVTLAAKAMREDRVPPQGSGGKAEVVLCGPEGGEVTAAVEVEPSGYVSRVRVEVDAGDPLDEIVLRSYAVGAAHMALGWVCAEALALDDEGMPADLTMRSFGVLRAKDTPDIEVVVRYGHGKPKPISDAVFVGVAAATWIAQGLPPQWPTLRDKRR